MNTFKVFHKKVLPPVALIEKCKYLAINSTAIVHQVLGKSEKGHDIDVFSFGSGEQSLLFYGFSDPGEAIGGTLILNILENVSYGIH